MGPVEPAVELTVAGTPGCLTRSQHACLATPASVVRHGARRWVPEDVLSELNRRARARGKDRATLLGELLRAALDRDKEDEVVAAYRSGHLSLSQAAAQLGTDVWSLFDTLAQRGETVSVSLEDWRDSGSSLSVQH